MLIVIIVIVLVVLVVGALVAKRGFTRGTMPDTPSADKPGRESVGADRDDAVSADPTAMGRPSDRGYDQKL